MWLLLIGLVLPLQESDQVDKALDKVVDKKGAGAAVLVMKEGKVLHKKGYGLAHIEKDVPITSKTIFRLASVSKQFTAYAIMILADREKLSFGDDVRKFVPELPEYGKKRPIRVEDLLHHKSGLPEYFELIEDSGIAESRVKNSDVAKMFKGTKLEFTTGTKFEYTNSNYLLLALIVERISKKSFGAFLKEEFFNPLKMEGASVYEKSGMVIPGQAYGYRKRRGRWRSESSPLATTGDGAIFLSLEHFILWEKELLKPTLVSKKTLKAAFTAGKLDSGKAFRYGYGWSVGRDGVNHGGSWAGASTFITRNLKNGITVVVLSNDDNFEPGRIADQIVRIYSKD